MSTWKVLLLAVIQGLTEFLPISSSGHLALAQHLLNMPQETMLPVTVILHFGTLLVLLIYFRNELWKIVLGIVVKNSEGRKMLSYTVWANIATALVVLPLEKVVRHTFTSVQSVALFLILTAVLLFLSDWRAKQLGQKTKCLSWREAILVGLAQGFAAFPGLSRSGTTISVGLICGLIKEQAGKFAFIVGIPAIAGANLLKAKDIASFPIGWEGITLATIITFVIGYLSVRWTLQVVSTLNLRWFGLYCLAAALVTAVFLR